MTTYELYINDTLCDLNTDEAITLLYQSPIFSDLDSIQSNRSYNISLPLSPTNIRAVEQSQRTDVNSEAPYVKLPARLYQNGVPLFTKGFAVVTDISDAINVTLTWGNVDNFQPLFDNNLQDLGPQLEDLGAGHIDWNEDSTILDGNTQNEYPGVAYWGVNFGMGLKDPQYIHPSVQAMTILEAIEKQHGITIDGKERLAYSPNLGPIVPLLGKNGDEISGKAEAATHQTRISLDGNHVLLASNSSNIEGLTSEGGVLFDIKGAKHVIISIRANFETVYGSPEFAFQPVFKICADDSDHPISDISGVTYSFEQITRLKMSISFDVNLSSISEGGTIPDGTSNLLFFLYTGDRSDTQYTGDNYIKLTAYPREDLHFPSKFPAGVNLPDMSQGDFVMGLMSMNGLFAYPDAKFPDTIRFISIDDIADKAKNYEVVDWSRKVVLNDMNRVDMPDTSEFTIGELAQRNTLDYENDDDVTSDTSGVIEIRNANIDKETELVTLPFSASENESTDGVTCAMVPIYEKQENGDVDYSECSARILSGRGAVIDGFVKCIGSFDPWMKFGGDQGIVAKRYASYKDIVDRVRVISVRAKLSPLDLYNLDYAKPVFIDQFGALFAIYSVETGEDGICDCQLIKINVVAKIYDVIIYYSLAGSMLQDVQFTASDYTATISCQFTNGVARISQKDIMSAFGLDGDNLYPLLDGYTLTTAIGRVLYEKQIVEGDIYMSEAPKEYYLKIQGVAADIDYSSIEAAGGSYSVRIDTDGTPYIISQDERLQASISGSGPIYSMTVVIPQNTSIYQVSYEPIVIGIRESVLLTRQITYTQQAAEQIDYYLKVKGAEEDIILSNIPYLGAEYNIKVETNGTPYIVSKDDRIEASLSGDGSTVYYIAVTIPKNSSTSPVNYEDLVTGIREDDSLRRKTSFKQSGAAQADYYLTINGSTDDYYVDVDAGAHELAVPIQTNGTIDVRTMGASFIHAASSEDNTFINISVDLNDGGISRNGTIGIYLNEDINIVRYIVVRQSNELSYYLKLNNQDSNVGYYSIPANGQIIDCPIDTNGSVEIYDKSDYVEASLTDEGFNLRIIVPENKSQESVSYFVRVRLKEDNSVAKGVAIVQLAAEPYYLRLNGSEDRYETTISSAAQSFTLSVETNGTPKVMPLPLEYIRIELSADGRSVTFTLDENTASEDRIIQALITLEEDSSVQRYVTITQQKADPPVEITFSNLTSLKLYFKNPDITSAYGTVDAGSDVRIVPAGDIGFYQMTTPALILKIVSAVSEVECGHWESEEPRRYVFEYDLFKREVYDKTGETEVIIKSGL